MQRYVDGINNDITDDDKCWRKINGKIEMALQSQEGDSDESLSERDKPSKNLEKKHSKPKQPSMQRKIPRTFQETAGDNVAGASEHEENSLEDVVRDVCQWAQAEQLIRPFRPL